MNRDLGFIFLCAMFGGIAFVIVLTNIILPEIINKEPSKPQEDIKYESSCLINQQTRFDQLKCMDNRIVELENRIKELEKS